MPCIAQSTLCTELVKRLLQFEAHLRAASLAVAELDCLMGFATVASNNAYCRPQLAPEPVLDIQGGRHPLAEVLVDTYIPNDTCMPADHGRVHVITGPNASGEQSPTMRTGLCCLCERTEALVGGAVKKLGYVHVRTTYQSSHSLTMATPPALPFIPHPFFPSLPSSLLPLPPPPPSPPFPIPGKSCYIKSVALIAYLAHLGSFVPATKAVVGLVDRIFTRLVSHENARLQQSTFMVDLSQASSCDSAGGHWVCFYA